MNIMRENVNAGYIHIRCAQCLIFNQSIMQVHTIYAYTYCMWWILWWVWQTDLKGMRVAGALYLHIPSRSFIIIIYLWTFPDSLLFIKLICQSNYSARAYRVIVVKLLFCATSMLLILCWLLMWTVRYLYCIIIAIDHPQAHSYTLSTNSKASDLIPFLCRLWA